MGRRLVAPDREPVFRCVAALAILPAPRCDVDGRYKDAPPHEWFNHLASQKGLLFVR